MEAQVDSSQKICCHFQEINQDLGTFKTRESVVVVGRGMGDGMMQVFGVESLNSSKRRFCLSCPGWRTLL